jgi:transcriptional regulator with XRE-family HTH domain
MDYEKLGLRVRQQREMSNLTQSQLARKTSVTASFIAHVERGEKKASVETIVALCNALEISPAVLLQDSLSDGALHSQVVIDEENQRLVRDLIHVLHEHNQRCDNY